MKRGLVCVRDGIVDGSGNPGNEGGVGTVVLAGVFDKDGEVAGPAVGKVEESGVVIAHFYSLDAVGTACLVSQCDVGR